MSVVTQNRSVHSVMMTGASSERPGDSLTVSAVVSDDATNPIELPSNTSDT